MVTKIEANNVSWDNVEFSAEEHVVKMVVKPMVGEINISVGMYCTDKRDVDYLIQVLKKMKKTLPD
jgi:selenocysteine lyase/cysteine desulfurase